MEEKSSIKAAMVSRLPKFGGRSSGGGAAAAAAATSSNGFSQPAAPSQDGKGAPAGTRPNGVICATPFSLKWKRDEGTGAAAPASPTAAAAAPGDGGEDKTHQTQPFSPAKDAKNGLPGTPRLRRSGALALAVSSPKAIPKQPLKISPKAGAALGQSPLNGGLKVAQSGGANSLESRLARPKLGPSSPRSSSQDSLSLSGEASVPGADNMVRSNSFTHFKQIPSPTSQPMTRSFSFNRAVELAKPLANTQLRPPRSAFLRPPQLSNGRIGPGLGSLNGSAGLGGGLQCSKTPTAAASSLPAASSALSAPGTPGALRKPLLPNCVLTKSLASSGGSLAYRLSSSPSPSPGQVKQQKILFPGRTRESRSVAAPDAPGLLGVARDSQAAAEVDKTDSYSESEGSSADGGGGREAARLALAQGCGPAAGETLEDMSLSSASSLDRGEFSDEFLDDCSARHEDFADRGDSSNRDQSLQSSLNDTLDWDNMDLEGHKEESPMEDSQGPLLLSSEQSDVLQASSVELSPSNSSGGTYMWDEDGLEPFVGAGINPCDNNDDSELNSMDILHNLEAPGNGELDDDDLMLDVDLPEDGSHDADRMSHIERLERGSRQGQRRKHQRWSGQDHFHYDSRSHHAVQHYDGLKAQRLSTRLAPSDGGRRGYMEMLDELTLEHMTQDCSLLKNQLLRLKTMLQLEDTDSSPDVPVETEDNSSASQLEELIKEVQVLKAELRTRDKTIAQLTFQLQQQQQEQTGQQTRCQCHHQRAPSSLQRDKRAQQHHHYDKATQTYWRPPAQGHTAAEEVDDGENKHASGRTVGGTDGQSCLCTFRPVGPLPPPAHSLARRR
ncbi:serine-rich coiled-coil domain-containing protein 2 isoform X3 [Nelusetta ayraudi]|uniref:serine-rich coiled-coil domain-containing protein 2 isoform X3 n=1 Tax=Nelusetta ayraudi TaxID=303726 RepID=UPI003F70C60C